MTDSIVFVLHGGADQAYAAALAAALAPAPAVPARLAEAGAPGVRFGSGGVCLVVWSRALAAANGAAAVLDALAHARGNAAICPLGGAPPPAALAHLPVAPISGQAGADLAVVRGVLARIEQRLAARDAAAAPALARPVSPLKSKQHLAVRGATGVAATFAVVGMVAPPIAERAQAIGPEPSAQPAAPAEAEPVALVEPDVQVVATAATSSTPLLDAWLPAAPAPATTMTVAADIEPVALSAASPEPSFAESSLLDPKRAAWEADGSGKDAPDAGEAKGQPHAAASGTSKDG